jgi:hypothetical protein
MIFALATLAFLFAAWLATVVLAGTIEDCGPKIRAALSEKAPAHVAAVSIRLRPRYDARRPLTPRVLRAAA